MKRYNFASFYRLLNAIMEPENSGKLDTVQDMRAIATTILEDAINLHQAISVEDNTKISNILGKILCQILFSSMPVSEKSNLTFDDICRSALHNVYNLPLPGETAEKNIVMPEHIRQEHLSSLKMSWKICQHMSSSDPEFMASHPEESIERIIRHINQKQAKGASVNTSIGRLLFEVARYSHYHGVEPESALHCANEQYTSNR